MPQPQIQPWCSLTLLSCQLHINSNNHPPNPPTPQQPKEKHSLKSISSTNRSASTVKQNTSICSDLNSERCTGERGGGRISNGSQGKKSLKQPFKIRNDQNVGKIFTSTQPPLPTTLPTPPLAAQLSNSHKTQPRVRPKYLERRVKTESTPMDPLKTTYFSELNHPPLDLPPTLLNHPVQYSQTADADRFYSYFQGEDPLMRRRKCEKPSVFSQIYMVQQEKAASVSTGMTRNHPTNNIRSTLDSSDKQISIPYQQYQIPYKPVKQMKKLFTQQSNNTTTLSHLQAQLQKLSQSQPYQQAQAQPPGPPQQLKQVHFKSTHSINPMQSIQCIQQPIQHLIQHEQYQQQILEQRQTYPNMGMMDYKNNQELKSTIHSKEQDQREPLAQQPPQPQQPTQLQPRQPAESPRQPAWSPRPSPSPSPSCSQKQTPPPTSIPIYQSLCPNMSSPSSRTLPQKPMTLAQIATCKMVSSSGCDRTSENHQSIVVDSAHSILKEGNGGGLGKKLKAGSLKTVGMGVGWELKTCAGSAFVNI